MPGAAAIGGAGRGAMAGRSARRLPPIDRALLWQTEGRRAILWLPVFLGLGVWIYFALPVEPSGWWGLLWLGPFAGLASGRARAGGAGVLALTLVALAVTSGFALAKWSTVRAAAPVVAHPMAETVEGRVIALSRSASGAPRVLLDRVIVYGLDPRETPERVRVTLLAAERETAPQPGARLRVYAWLSPPGGPVEPGAFDFRLRAWFERLGAVGYARAPALEVPGAAPSGWRDTARLWLAVRRLQLSDALQRQIRGEAGAFAAAIVTGDRSAIAEEDAEALRLSNLAHLLAISGLHMGILTGLVFASVRFALAFWPGLSRRLSAKKLAALAALAAGAGYLALSGATVATQRAYVMVAVALVAVLLDRPAISLRALALAAVIVLAVRPVSLLDVGFQMSFAATAALVAGYEALRQRRHGRARVDRSTAGRLLRGIGVYAAALLFTSLLAGLATGPYAAWHFNRAAPWGLLANLGAVPAMGLVIAPSAIAAGVLAPLGLAAPALQAMGAGIDWVLRVAHFVAGLPGADRPVVAAGPEVLVLVTLGGLWLCLWRGWWRGLGVVPVGVALALWSAGEPRPDLLIAPEGRLIGLMGPEGRTLSHDRAQSFVAKNWLRRDADPVAQAEAAARPGLTLSRGRAGGVLANGWRVELVRSREPDPDELKAMCRERMLLIVPSQRELSGPCLFLGRDALRTMGAVAVRIDGDGLSVMGATGGSDRPWEE